MDSSFLYFGLLPALLFVLIDSFSSKKAAIIGATAMAVLELAFTLIMYGAIDFLSVMAVCFALFFGFLSFKLNNDIYFKLQTPILNTFFAAAFLFSYHILKRPLLTVMMEKYMPGFVANLEATRGIDTSLFMGMLNTLSRDMGIWLLLHSSLTAYAALKLSKWVWFLCRVPLFYVMLFIAVLKI